VEILQRSEHVVGTADDRDLEHALVAVVVAGV
jgi:hypothetical protein